jgi:hypothetical protein
LRWIGDDVREAAIGTGRQVLLAGLLTGDVRIEIAAESSEKTVVAPYTTYWCLLKQPDKQKLASGL